MLSKCKSENWYDFYKPDMEDWQLMIISRNAKETTGFLIMLSIEFRYNYTGRLYSKTDWNFITNFAYIQKL